MPQFNPKESIRRLRNVPVRKNFIAAFRAELVSHMKTHSVRADAEPETRAPRFWFPAGRKTAALAGAAGIFALFAGSALAAQGSMPGDVLYPLKLSEENVRVRFARTPEHRAELELAFARARLAEIHAVLRDKNRAADDIRLALRNLDDRAERASATLDDIRRDGRPSRALEMAEDFRAVVGLYKDALEAEGGHAGDGRALEAAARIQSVHDLAEAKIAALEEDAHERRKRGETLPVEIELDNAGFRIEVLENRAEKEKDLTDENRNAARDRLSHARAILDEIRQNRHGAEPDETAAKIQKSRNLAAEAKAMIEEMPKIELRGRGPENPESENSVQENGRKSNSGSRDESRQNNSSVSGEASGKGSQDASRDASGEENGHRDGGEKSGR